MEIRLNLMNQYPINFYGIKVYQPTLNDIFNYTPIKYKKNNELKSSVDLYLELLFPYSITWDMLDISEDLIGDLKYFDIILNDCDLLNIFIESLQFFCRTDDIKYSTFSNSFYINNGILNRDNFDEFSEIILKINAREKPKKEKLPDNPRQRELELKFRELRAKHKTNSEFELWDIINNVEYGGKYYIPREDILNMTLWGLYNAFNSKIGQSSYDNNFSIALVQGDKNNTLRDSHWTKLLKIIK